MLQFPGRVWGRGLAAALAAVALLVMAAATAAAAGHGGVAEERVFPWLVVPVVLFMGSCLYVMFMTEEDEGQTDHGSRPHGDPGADDELAGEAQTGS